jgi:putative PIN family toxin of toxin-antitoxin system
MLWGGSPAEIIRAAEEKRIDVIISEAIVREISETLAYPRLSTIYEGAGLSRHLLVETVLCIGKLVEATDGVGVEIQDPADEKFLECSLSSDADYLVSGDKHLLRVGVVERTRIVSVAEFVEILRGRTPLSSRV